MMSAHCINLRRRPDRRACITSHFSSAGVPVSFIDAVDGHSPTVIASLPSASTVSSSEFACSLSHRLCWQALLDSPDPFHLIVEDDVRLTPAFIPAVAAALKKGIEWDLLHVGYNWYIEDDIIDAHTRIGRATATHAYVVSRAGADLLLRDFDLTQSAVDIFFFHHPTLRRVLLHPSVAYQADRRDSDIAEGRRTTLDDALGDAWPHCQHSRGLSHSIIQHEINQEKARLEAARRGQHGSSKEDAAAM